MKTTYLLFIVTLSIMTMGNIQAQPNSSYYFNKSVNYSYEIAIEKVKAALKEQEFGIITEIDMHETLAEKLEGVSIQPYKILGACNPKFAYQTMQIEENIGLFLPCKVLIKKVDDNTTEVVMVNPSAMMQMLGNKELLSVADEVTERFKKALETI